MPEKLRADHLSFQLAAQPRRRILWTCAALFFGMGLLASLGANPDRLAGPGRLIGVAFALLAPALPAGGLRAARPDLAYGATWFGAGLGDGAGPGVAAPMMGVAVGRLTTA